MYHAGKNSIRDPVHRWITYSDKEKKVIGSPLMQRLRYVSQLTSVDQVFPGGDHSRFIHSLGVMHLAGCYMTTIIENSTTFLPHDSLLSQFQNKYIQIARLAGLLHDIGHGPFSHAFDWSIYKQIYGVNDGGHDYHRHEIVKSPMMRPFLVQCGVEPADLIAVWDPTSEAYLKRSVEEQSIFDIIHNVVQGPLGADRMDFTLRDSYFTGTGHLGTIADDRIISNAVVVPVKVGDKGRRLCLHYDIKCLNDIIQALDGRFHMYDSVYLHKAVYAASLLISKMIEHAAPALDLIEKTKDWDQFQWLNEHMVVGAIMQWFSYPTDDADLRAAIHYCQKWLHRKLPKLRKEIIVPATTPFRTEDYAREVQEVRMDSETGPGELEVIRTRSISAIDASKFEKANIFFYDRREKRSISCSEALDHIRYAPSQQPFYYVRIYEMP
jgi:hypothetical protein